MALYLPTMKLKSVSVILGQFITNFHTEMRFWILISLIDRIINPSAALRSSSALRKQNKPQ